MKSITLLPFCLFILASSLAVTGQVGIGTTTPRGALEINSSTNGFIAPRVALTSVTESSPVVNPQEPGNPISGTFVYNTSTTGTYPNNVSPGFYFWNGGSWAKFVTLNTSSEIIEDIRVPLDKWSSAADLQYFSGSTGPKIWVFRNNNLEESMSFSVQFPNNWKEGTTIYPKLHWVPRATDAGDVQWNLDYYWVNVDGTFSAPTTITGISSGSFTKDNHLVTNIGTGIVGTGKTASSILICRIWRDSNITTDTYANDVGCLSIDFRITLNNQIVENPE
jgi:hypothetical protein